MSAVGPSPAERVALSRERMRQALQAAAPRRPANDPSGAPPALPWLDRLKAIPGAGIAIDAISHWWARHPAQPTVSLVGHGTEVLLRPIAQRHPWALVFGAMAVGALIVWARPWRWARPALVAGLLPQLLLAGLRAARPPSNPARSP